MKPSLSREKRLWRLGYPVIAGVDEVGRGAWAGPLVAAAVVVEAEVCLRAPWRKLIKDSKLLTSPQRARILKLVAAQLIWATGTISNKVIDVIGLAEANRRAVELSVINLKVRPQQVLVDYVVRLPAALDGLPAETIVDGDAKVFSIALASIIAKVERDRIMMRYDQRFPSYGFAKHKGYGTRQHQEALLRLGPTPLHRFTYRPIKAQAAIMSSYERRGDS